MYLRNNNLNQIENDKEILIEYDNININNNDKDNQNKIHKNPNENYLLCNDSLGETPQEKDTNNNKNIEIRELVSKEIYIINDNDKHNDNQNKISDEMKNNYYNNTQNSLNNKGKY
jgi:hypothetical protein